MSDLISEYVYIHRYQSCGEMAWSANTFARKVEKVLWLCAARHITSHHMTLNLMIEH